jgi:RpiB/LacA/LacB family sugar-phosphate isomerase
MGDRIVLGSDHRGFALKRALVRRLAEAGFEVSDLGPSSDDPVDYPDFAAPAARAVSEGEASRAIVICGSGLGVTYTANRFPRVRAALVHDAASAALARQHNDANVLALSADRADPESAWRIVSAWLETPFEGGRHVARVAKIDALTRPREDAWGSLAASDPELLGLVRREARRQAGELDLRPLANYASRAVMELLGSVLAHRSGAFGASPLASEAESLARERALNLFRAEGAEVRLASLFHARQVLAPDPSEPTLAVGAELADPRSGRLDLDLLSDRALALRPSLLLVRAEEFVRALDFAELRRLADSLGARLAVDLGGLAGLVAADVLPSPVAAADEVGAASDRTLRGPRGGLMLFRARRAAAVAAAVGRPISSRPGAHEVAALAVALREAAEPAFRAWALRVRDGARALASGLAERGIEVFSGGTDTHTVELRLRAGEARPSADRLARAGLRGEVRSRGAGEVLLLATAAITTRGLDAEALGELPGAVADVLAQRSDVEAVRRRVDSLCRRFPLHQGLWSEAD